jgi:hypothetical protein
MTHLRQVPVSGTEATASVPVLDSTSRTGQFLQFPTVFYLTHLLVANVAVFQLLTAALATLNGTGMLLYIISRFYQANISSS